MYLWGKKHDGGEEHEEYRFLGVRIAVKKIIPQDIIDDQ